MGTATLKLCFTLHFLLPFFMFAVVMVHLFALHSSGSSTFLGYSGNLFKIPFYPFYVVKDLINILVISLMFFFLLSFPYYLGDPEMFLCSSPMVSPVHIVPEWYFLFAYAILRSIPSKGLGALSIALGLLALPLLSFCCTSYYPVLSDLTRALTYSFAFNFILLSWVGQCPLEAPYLHLGQVSLILYFFLLVSLMYPSLSSGLLYKPSVKYLLKCVIGL